MARPRKQGLDYFPLNVDYFSDEKIIPISVEFGPKGELTTLRLLCAVYRNGYFIEWDEKMRMTILYTLPGVSAELLDQIVSRLVKWGFFDKDLFDSANVLTSQGIQRRYFEIAKYRLRDDSLPHLLISPKGNYAKKGVSQQLTPVSQQLTPQIKEKEIKLNKTSPDGDVKETADKPAVSTTGTTGDFEKNIPSGLPPDIGGHLRRILLIAPTLAASNGFTVSEIAETAIRVARDWSLTGEYSRKDPVSHMRNTVLKILRNQPRKPIGTSRAAPDSYTRQREEERREIDRAYSIDSAAALQAYLESQGLPPGTSLADVANKPRADDAMPPAHQHHSKPTPTKSTVRK